jgi:ATP-dependent Clp protease ATP-binding subunit ClpB
VIFFHALSEADIQAIIGIQVAQLLKRLEERKIHVVLTDSAKDLLVREGYDPMYGARPLKRALQRLVLDPLALHVLEGEFGEGDNVVVEAADAGLTFARRQNVEA